jgi:hypothetical protein
MFEPNIHNLDKWQYGVATLSNSRRRTVKYFGAKKFEYSITGLGNNVVRQNMIGDIFFGTPCTLIMQS